MIHQYSGVDHVGERPSRLTFHAPDSRDNPINYKSLFVSSSLPLVSIPRSIDLLCDNPSYLPLITPPNNTASPNTTPSSTDSALSVVSCQQFLAAPLALCLTAQFSYNIYPPPPFYSLDRAASATSNYQHITSPLVATISFALLAQTQCLSN
jgi:hypothetical protein